MSYFWCCDNGHAVLEGQPHDCPWCRIQQLEVVVRAAQKIVDRFYGEPRIFILGAEVRELKDAVDNCRESWERRTCAEEVARMHRNEMPSGDVRRSVGIST